MKREKEKKYEMKWREGGCREEKKRKLKKR